VVVLLGEVVRAEHPPPTMRTTWLVIAVPGRPLLAQPERARVSPAPAEPSETVRARPWLALANLQEHLARDDTEVSR
jgi:hypothetical protein